MDLQLTDEQHDLRSVAARMLDAKAPLSLARTLLEDSGDPTPLWRQFAELGWYGVGVFDGDGIGVPGLAVLSRLIGEHAAPSLVADTVVVARIVADAGDDAVASTWTEVLAEGASPTTLAVLDGAASWNPTQLLCEATPADSGYLLNGIKLGVRHGSHAAAIAVLAETGQGPGLFMVRPGTPGVTVAPERTLDPAAGECTVVLEDVAVPPQNSIAGPTAAAAVGRGLRVGAIAAAAEGIGAASAALELAIAYCTERRQYGRLIGSFQALQHLLAEAHVLRETAWSTVLYAAAATDQGLDDAETAAGVAKAHASRAARRVVEDALQAFGGVAFTWEHDYHLLARRTMSAEQRFGDSLHHERRLAQLLAGSSLATAET
jgi:alkylation response protein AidB-like acyl-CoA dehydrogenase